MSQKTNKSYSKRLRVTPSGKLVSRTPGFNHFNAKQSRSKQINGKVDQEFSMKPKDLGRFLPGFVK